MPILPERESLGTEQPALTEVGKVPEVAEQEGLKSVSPQSVVKPVVTDQGQVVLSPSSSITPNIVLPMTQKTFFDPKTIHQPVTKAVRWLWVWIKKIIQKNPGGTVFKEET